MMKSIFLSESKFLDMDANSTNDNDSNEYIMVETRSTLNEEEGDNYCYDDDHSNSTFCDDDDYDYCDDASSEGIQSGSLHINLTEDMILEEASEQPSIQHILDEAHRSASELGVSMDDKNTENDNQNQRDTAVPGFLESSASDASVLSGDAEQTTEENNCPSMEICTTAEEETTQPVATAAAEDTEPKPTKATLKLSNVAAFSDPAKEPSSAQEQKPPMGGRMSNKKRRKKMKLMKKAAAAAKAAAALSGPSKDKASPASTSSKTSTSPKVSTPSRYNKKRVANIAVACATETLACYKAELAHKKLQ